MIKTMVISAFPACGKTWLAKNWDTTNLGKEKVTALELDSSRYDKTQFDWVKAYVADVRANVGKHDFIFVSMQDAFLEELKNEGIPFVTVGPNNADWATPLERRLVKQQWFGRFVLRDNGHIKDFDAWLDTLRTHYDEWTSVAGLTAHSPVAFFLLRQDQYLSDIIEELYLKKEHYDRYNASIVTEA